MWSDPQGERWLSRAVEESSVRSPTLVQLKLNSERRQRCRRSAPACSRIRVRTVILYSTGGFVPQDSLKSDLLRTLIPIWICLLVEKESLGAGSSRSITQQAQGEDGRRRHW